MLEHNKYIQSALFGRICQFTLNLNLLIRKISMIPTLLNHLMIRNKKLNTRKVLEMYCCFKISTHF